MKAGKKRLRRNSDEKPRINTDGNREEAAKKKQ